MKTVIHSTRAPQPVGPYSQAIRANGFVFASGQIGLDPQTGKLVPGGIGPETRQAMENLKAVLTAAGSDLSRVVKATVFLRDMADFSQFNAIYGPYFGEGPPARSTFQVAALPLGASVEIEVVAALEPAK